MSPVSCDAVNQPDAQTSVGWLITSCSSLLEAEGSRGAVPRTALCHLRRAVPWLFPAQMEVNASLSLPGRPKVPGKERKTAHSCQNPHLQEVLLCDVLMSAGDQTQHRGGLNGDLKEEAFKWPPPPTLPCRSHGCVHGCHCREFSSSRKNPGFSPFRVRSCFFHFSISDLNIGEYLDVCCSSLVAAEINRQKVITSRNRLG